MKRNILAVGVIGAAAILAALGCWFLWNFPMEWVYGANQHRLFERQLLWHAVGIAFFFGAWALGWKRWLRAAPWLLIAWIGLCFMAQMSPAINGAHRWIRLGVLRLNVQTMLWPVAALFAGWLCSYRRIKPWMIYVLIGCLCLIPASMILSNANRATRFIGFFANFDPQYSKIYMQYQMRTAIEASNWIGCAGRSLRYLPCAHTDSILAGVALTLGKCVSVCAIVLMGIIGGCLVKVRKMNADPSKRMYTLLFGAVLLGTAAWCCLQNLLLVPAIGCTFSLLGYGGTDVLFSWLGLGIALSTLRDGEEVSDRTAPWVAWGVILAVVGILASAFCWAPLPHCVRFGEPRPKASDLGEFGTQHVRGTILAADGTLLAKSVAEWQVHVDPKSVRYSSSMSSNDVVEAVARGLALPIDKVREIYGNQKSRYVLLRSRVSGEMLEWCQVEWHKRCYGLVLEKVQRRNYPLGADAAQITGTCIYDEGRISGTSGLEHSCRKVLTGQNGKVAFGQSLAENMRTGIPTNGGVVKTTVQVPIQRAVSRILNESAILNQAESAWVIAVRIPKGEIVAMAAYPTYDPNALDHSVDYMKALANGAVQTLHEPGGLMKPLAYALAVDAGCVKPGEIRDWNNATFTNLCHNIGTNRMWQGLMKLRFGQKLGEGMLCGEETGIVYQSRRWSPVTVDCFGIGQGLAVTGVQLAQAYATLANGGVRVAPYLVESMADASGKSVWEHAIKPEERVVSLEAAKATTHLMLAQTNIATCVTNTSAAGKTSTFALVEEHREYEVGRYSTKNFDALYAGYFPAEKPVYVVVLGFRKPQPEHVAEKVAQPAFKRIMKAIQTEIGRSKR